MIVHLPEMLLKASVTDALLAPLYPIRFHPSVRETVFDWAVQFDMSILPEASIIYPVAFPRIN